MENYERIETLLDVGSFVEIEKYNSSANVITGYGTIDQRLVFVYSQHGAVNISHAKKIASLYKAALNMGAPVIGFLDSKGISLDDGIEVLEAYGQIFSVKTDASGVIPQISIIVGDCLGVATFTPALSDYVIMPSQKTRFMMSSPQTLAGLDGKSTTENDLGGSEIHAEKTGIVHITCNDESECIQSAKKLISFIPSNNLESSVCFSDSDDLNRIDETLNSIVCEDKDSSIDIHTIITSVVDNREFFEIKKGFAKNVVTGFGRFNGRSSGIVFVTGKLCASSIEKTVTFLRFCNAFNMPIVTFTDISGYKNTYAEQVEIIKNSSRLLHAFSNSTVPKINIIVKNCVGNAYLIMNSKHIGADMVYAWDNAKISIIPTEANKVMLNNALDTSAENAAEKGYIDDIIKPSETRKIIIAALEMLASKHVMKPQKKHSSLAD